ncbi:hypothetical protein BD311DRAFT_345312 [Dichomitus squalens]|uniref:Uncharacterized protein n=1 Tax=Dichomitus squalens TaxID=114155 RepID=A0A4Q9N2S4_9APHY|nr:hypothetical protein BD311DRAFT_345312 [Dichomitus squalens]
MPSVQWLRHTRRVPRSRSESLPNRQFLSDVVKSHDLILFGSLFWPIDPDNIPFVISHGAHYAEEIPVEVQKKFARPFWPTGFLSKRFLSTRRLDGIFRMEITMLASRRTNARSGSLAKFMNYHTMSSSIRWPVSAD